MPKKGTVRFNSVLLRTPPECLDQFISKHGGIESVNADNSPEFHQSGNDQLEFNAVEPEPEMEPRISLVSALRDGSTVLDRVMQCTYSAHTLELLMWRFRPQCSLR